MLQDALDRFLPKAARPPRSTLRPAGAGAGVEARLRVLLPADAQLYLEDVLQRRTTDAGYHIRTPPLEPGADYYYLLRAELARGDRRANVERKVTLRAGKTKHRRFALAGSDARRPITAAATPNDSRRASAIR